MKYKDLTIEAISTMNKEELKEVRWAIAPVSTCVRKTLKKLEAKPVMSAKDGRELAGARNSLAKCDALLEAMMCRQDELHGAGVLSSYDHSERFC